MGLVGLLVCRGAPVHARFSFVVVLGRYHETHPRPKPHPKISTAWRGASPREGHRDKVSAPSGSDRLSFFPPISASLGKSRREIYAAGRDADPKLKPDETMCLDPLDVHALHLFMGESDPLDNNDDDGRLHVHDLDGLGPFEDEVGFTPTHGQAFPLTRGSSHEDWGSFLGCEDWTSDDEKMCARAQLLHDPRLNSSMNHPWRSDDDGILWHSSDYDDEFAQFGQNSGEEASPMMDEEPEEEVGVMVESRPSAKLLDHHESVLDRGESMLSASASANSCAGIDRILEPFGTFGVPVHMRTLTAKKLSQCKKDKVQWSNGYANFPVEVFRYDSEPFHMPAEFIVFALGIKGNNTTNCLKRAGVQSQRIKVRRTREARNVQPILCISYSAAVALLTHHIDAKSRTNRGSKHSAQKMLDQIQAVLQQNKGRCS